MTMEPIVNGIGHPAPTDEDVDYTDIDEKYAVELEEGFDNVLVVDGLPIIDKSKYDRLVAKVAREFAKRGVPIPADKCYLPWNATRDESKGFAFVEFDTTSDATLALNAMHGFRFDSKHQFAINRFTEIETFAHMDDVFQGPTIEPYKAKEHLRSWLADDHGRDQYVTYHGEDVEIHWHGKPSQSDIQFKKSQWTDLYVAWSPLGTMMATVHRQGIRLWGGKSWEPVQRFAHPLVKLIDFSPCENYLVTWSNDPFVIREGADQGPQFPSAEDEGNHLAVWNIHTGHLLRTFPVIQSDQIGAESQSRKQMQWPALKWSPDDKFVARVMPGSQISVYELPGMGLLEKKSIKIEGVMDFEWCPLPDRDTEEELKNFSGGSKATKRAPLKNIIAYWVPEVANQPARASLMSIPSRNILRSKNLFSVTDLYWQNQGDFLCVKVDRHTKTKKSLFCNLEIFRLREKDFPVEVVELKDTTVTDFSWEPKGERFAIISSTDPNLGNPGPGVNIKTDVGFFQLETGRNFRLLRTLGSRTTNTVRWSPKGRHVVLATVGSSSKSELEFWDLDFHTDDGLRKDLGTTKEEWGTGLQLLGTADHYGVTDIEWDPSGRYLATSASVWRHSLEHGYAIWDFRGHEMIKLIQDRFKQLLWRPRPRTLLSREQQKQVRKNLKEYSRSFDEEDAAEESQVSSELIAHRRRLVDEWNAWRLHCQNEVDERRRKERVDLNDGEDKEEEEVHEWLDEVVEQTEEIVQE